MVRTMQPMKLDLVGNIVVPNTGGGGEKTRGGENTFLATFISPLRELLPTSGLHQLEGWTR